MKQSINQRNQTIKQSNIWAINQSTNQQTNKPEITRRPKWSNQLHPNQPNQLVCPSVDNSPGINQSVNQPTNQSIKLENQSTNQSKCQSSKQSNNHSNNLTDQTVQHSIFFFAFFYKKKINQCNHQNKQLDQQSINQKVQQSIHQSISSSVITCLTILNFVIKTFFNYIQKCFIFLYGYIWAN